MSVKQEKRVSLNWVELPKAPTHHGQFIVEYATYLGNNLLVVSCDMTSDYFTYTYRGETYSLKAKDFQKAKTEALGCAEYDYSKFTCPKK